MSYSNSNLDKALFKWFKSDQTCATLHRIKLTGSLRGLTDLSLELDYPISVVAGKNGCGKTTVLALGACAYHNTGRGFKFKGRNRSYYTFSDFFIQTGEEQKQDGIHVDYTFLHDNWKGVPPGFARQAMTKRLGGKWSKYQRRIQKNVVYLGIDRIVPQIERSVFKNKLKIFQDDKVNAWYNDVEKIVGKILGKDYSQFKIKKAGNYDLQLVKEGNIVYSGFNMGAGEKALFEFFSLVHECSQNSKGTLIVIDEIELGLHELAQKRLMLTLKELCKQLKLQIICTTHSPAIIDSVPPEGRFYLDKNDDATIVTKGISGSFAAGRLADTNSNELDILVEDHIGSVLLEAQFSLELRKRVGVISIGSWAAVCRQLSAAYRHPRLKAKTIAVIDGDQSTIRTTLIETMVKELELSTEVQKTKFKEWVDNRLFFVPGTINPEKWILTEALKVIDPAIAKRYDVTVPTLRNHLNSALQQNVHEEFYHLSNLLSVREDVLLDDFCRLLAANDNMELVKLISEISSHLD